MNNRGWLEVLTDIDWVLLRSQKAFLLTQADIFDGKENLVASANIMGLVHLIDALQDAACSSGLANYKDVFGDKFPL